MVVISFKKGDTIFMKFSEDGSAAQWRDVLVQACDNSLKGTHCCYADVANTLAELF